MLQNYKKGGKVKKRKIRGQKKKPDLNISQVVNINLSDVRRRRKRTIKKLNKGSLDKYKPVITKNETFLKAPSFIGSSNVSPYLLIDENRRELETRKKEDELFNRLLKEIDDRKQKQADDIIPLEKEEDKEIEKIEIKPITIINKLSQIYGDDNEDKINSVFNFLKEYYSGRTEKEILKFIKNIDTSEDMADFMIRKQKQRPWKF